MKKCILSIIYLFVYFLSGNAQKDIKVEIESITKNEIQYIKIKVENKNPYDIILFTRASYLSNGQIGSSLPATYMQLIGNPFTTGDGITGPNRQRPTSMAGGVLETNILSDPIVFSGTVGSTGANIKKALEIKAGAVYEDSFPLFGYTPSPYVGFSIKENYEIRTVQLKLKLAYHYLGDKSLHRAELLSNVLNVIY